MKRLVAVLTLVLMSGCQLSAVPQLFVPPKGSGKVLAASAAPSSSPAAVTPGTPATPAPSGATITLTVDGQPVALQGAPSGSAGSYSYASEAGLGTDQWNVSFSLSPADALQRDPLDPSAFTLTGSFRVGTPDGIGGKIRMYPITNVTKLTKDGQIDSLTRTDGKLNLTYSATLSGIPSDGSPKKRFVLTARNLPL